MTKTIRTVEAKKAAQELWGKKMLEQHKLLISLMKEVKVLQERMGKLENINHVALQGQIQHQDKMITGSQEWKTVDDKKGEKDADSN